MKPLIRQIRSVLGLALSASMIAITVLVTPEAGAQESAKHLVTLDDLKGLKETAQLQLSPDGTMAAYKLYDRPELWLVKTQPHSVPRSLGKGTFPVFSPDSRKLAYYSSASGSFQLWVLSLVSGRRQQVTHVRGGIQPDPATWVVGRSGYIYDSLRYSWSPDGRKIVFPSQVPVLKEPSAGRQSDTRPAALGEGVTPLVLTPQTPPDWTLAGLFRVGGFSKVKLTNGNLDFSKADANPPPVTTNQLFIVDITTKSVTQLTRGDYSSYTPSWSPDGRKIVCVSNEGQPSGDGQTTSTNLYLIDVATGFKSPLTSGPGYRRIPSWSPDGKSIAFFGASTDHPNREYLLVVPSTGGELRNLSLALDRRPIFAYWSPDSQSIVANYKDGANIPVARLSVADGNVEVISDPESAGRYLLAGSMSGALAWSQSDPSAPEIIRYLPFGKQSSYEVADLNPQVRNWKTGAQEVVRWKNAGGDDMEGVLIKPVGYKPGHRYPLIVDAYPKLGNSFKGDPMWGNQVLATRGYAVFFPNGDGPHVWENPWRSMLHTTRAQGPAGVDIAVDDVVSGVDTLIDRGIVDPDRMCLYGFSNGGGMVDQVITMSHRFQCAVSVAGAVAADWSSLLFLDTRDKFLIDIAGISPWENSQSFTQLSAVYRLNNVTTPLLLADGDDDGNFLFGCIEMYNGLRYLGKDVTLLRYPKQGHGFTGSAMRDFWKRENEFFDRYLKPTPLSRDQP